MTTIRARQCAHCYAGWSWPRRELGMMAAMPLVFDGWAPAPSDEPARGAISCDPVPARPLHGRGLPLNLDPAERMGAQTAKAIRAFVTDPGSQVVTAPGRPVRSPRVGRG